jgi:hypothetical protein
VFKVSYIYTVAPNLTKQQYATSWAAIFPLLITMFSFLPSFLFIFPFTCVFHSLFICSVHLQRNRSVEYHLLLFPVITYIHRIHVLGFTHIFWPSEHVSLPQGFSYEGNCKERTWLTLKTISSQVDIYSSLVPLVKKESVVSLSVSPINYSIPGPIFMKLCIYVLKF